MPNQSAKSLLMVAALSALAFRAGAEGRLERFERDATQSRVSQPAALSGPSSGPAASSSVALGADDFYVAVMETVPVAIAAGGRHSWRRVQAVAYDAEGRRIPPREPGDALIPYARLDTAYRRVSSHLNGEDVRAEVGYGPIGFSARQLRYRERGADSDLQFWQHHVLYRMSAGEVLEIDFGYGKVHIQGAADHSGVSWTLPVLFHPTPNWGIEYRPVWIGVSGSESVDDELALSIGNRFWAVRAGYHRLRSPVERMQGPLLGFSVRL